MKNKIISIFLISTILASLSFTGCGKENNISNEDKVSIDKLFNHQKEIFSKDYLNNHQVNITGNMDLSIQSDLFALYAGMASEENSEIEFDTSEENSKMIIDMKLNSEMTSKYSHESNTTTTTICGVSETSDSQMYYDDEKLIRYTFDEDINGWTYSKEDETFLETFSFGAINELSLTGNDKNSSEENNKESKDQLTDFLSALKKEYKNSDIKVDNDGKSYIIDKKINLVNFIGEDDKLDDLTGYADLVLKFDKDDYDLNYIKLNLNEEAKTVIDKYLSSYGIHFESMNIQLNLDWQDKASVSIPKDVIDNAVEDFGEYMENNEVDEYSEEEYYVSFSSSKFNLYNMTAKDIINKIESSEEKLTDLIISVETENGIKEITAYDITKAMADVLTYCSNDNMDIATASIGSTPHEAYAVTVDILHKNGIVSDEGYEAAKEYIQENFDGIDMNNIAKIVTNNKIDNIFEKIK